MISTDELAQLRIGALRSSFAAAVSHKSPQDLAQLFAVDGRWIVGKRAFVGPHEIAQGLTTLSGNSSQVQQFAVDAPIHLDVSGDRAEGTCGVLEFHFGVEGSDYQLVGNYQDVLEFRDERWVFVERTFTLVKRVEFR